MSKELPVALTLAILLLGGACYEGPQRAAVGDVEVRNEASLAELQRRLADYEEALGLKQSALEELRYQMDELVATGARPDERDALQRQLVEIQAEIRLLEEGFFDVEDALAAREE